MHSTIEPIAKLGQYFFYRFSGESISEGLLVDLLDFLVPADGFSDAADRQKEIDIYLQYLDQSIVFIVLKNEAIIATSRLIYKYSESEALPIEFATVTKDVEPMMSDWFVEGRRFSVTDRCDTLPAVEIGGLKIGDSIKALDRFRILSALYSFCESVVIKNAKWLFITCADDDSMCRLHERNAVFRYAARITYDGIIAYRALARNDMRPLSQNRFKSSANTAMVQGALIVEEEESLIAETVSY